MTMPSHEELLEARVGERLLHANLAASMIEPDQPTSAPSAAAVQRANHAHEAASLEVYAAAIAAVFDCPALTGDAGRNLLRASFAAVRALARHYGASGEVRRLDPPATASPARSNRGQFARRA